MGMRTGCIFHVFLCWLVLLLSLAFNELNGRLEHFEAYLLPVSGLEELHQSIYASVEK